MEPTFTLYSYYRSSASYRVRIALNLKNLKYNYQPINLVKNGGEQYSKTYCHLNPLSQVPCLIHNDRPITQSMAIIQYLDEICPDPPLFPGNALDRATIVQLCELINSGIQPLQNSSVIAELGQRFQATEEQKAQWLKFWINKGLKALNETLKKTSGEFSFGDQVTAADCFLVPQVYSSKRFGVDVTPYAEVLRIYEELIQIEAFQLAEPSRQPDAV